jgi:Uma2 family endonuclease
MPDCQPRMTQDEFFAWAEVQQGRHEFDGFRPMAMTGGTRNHSQIAANILFALISRLDGSPCTVLGANAGVETLDGAVRYPDVVVTCTASSGKVRKLPDPVLVFEVISDGSARDDRIIKLAEYHAVPSIKRTVIVEQDSIGMMVFSRIGTETWNAISLKEGDILMLPELGHEIPVAEFYKRVSF